MLSFLRVRFKGIKSQGSGAAEGFEGEVAIFVITDLQTHVVRTVQRLVDFVDHVKDLCIRRREQLHRLLSI